MDQRFISGGRVLSAILLGSCGLMILPVGIGGLVSYPDKAWLFGLVLTGCSLVLIVSGITAFKKTRREEKTREQQAEATKTALLQKRIASITPRTERTANEQVATETSTLVEAIEDTTVAAGILCCWTYTKDEWARFLTYERKQRLTSTTSEAVALILLGTIFLHLTRDEGWLVPLLVSTGVAAIYWVGKYFLSMASIGKKQVGANEVVITSTAVIINGKVNPFVNEQYWLGKVELKQGTEQLIIEITYNWKTRGGVTNSEIRVPVPAGKQAEAKEVVARLS